MEPKGGSTLNKNHLGAIYTVCVSKMQEKGGCLSVYNSHHPDGGQEGSLNHN